MRKDHFTIAELRSFMNRFCDDLEGAGVEGITLEKDHYYKAVSLGSDLSIYDVEADTTVALGSLYDDLLDLRGEMKGIQGGSERVNIWHFADHLSGLVQYIGYVKSGIYG